MKFILTPELGRLAKWLRILGYDSVYFKESNFSSLPRSKSQTQSASYFERGLLIQTLREGRVVLTRNHRFLKKASSRALEIKSEKVKEQIKQVLKELNLKPQKHLMFSRCVICNEELKSIEKEKVKEKIPEYVYQTENDFLSCPVCQRIYWQGSHWGNVQRYLIEASS
ncbi:MAG: Mut7-C RNAse domain-containing protein [Candidatus Omnitrophica bacterium]|nr:Mut7-C RNAse domain-containing protein [Candidatus Omnitrophota bacterium]